MYIDNQAMLAGTISNGVITGKTIPSASSAVGDNVYDLGSARDLGSSETLDVTFVIGTAVAGTGSPTVTFAVVTATASDGTTGQQILATTPALAATELTAGQIVVVPIARSALNATIAKGQRYLTCKITGGGTSISAGTVTAFIGMDSQDPAAKLPYPAGYAVL